MYSLQLVAACDRRRITETHRHGGHVVFLRQRRSPQGPWPDAFSPSSSSACFCTAPDVLTGTTPCSIQGLTENDHAAPLHSKQAAPNTALYLN